MIRRTLTLFAAVFALALPLAAQTGATADPRPVVSEAIAVDEVLLDVLVTDKKGNVILGLDEDDFVIEEDGERVEIRDVTFYSNRRFLESSDRAAALGIDAEAVPVDRFFVLFFHDQRQLFFRLAAQQLDAARRAKQWVRSELLPNDYVAVVSYRYDLRLHQDFTNDPEALSAAIDEAARGQEPRTARSHDAEAPSLFAGIDPDAAGDADRIYDALEMIGDGAEAVRGRTNLVLFSAGFGEVDSFGFYRPDRRFYPDMVETLNEHNVAVYAIDTLPTSLSTRLFPNLLGSALSTLASDTGGEYFFNFVSFFTPLEQISQSLNGYYLISFGGTESEEDYRKVDVDTVDPELRVRTREGYRYGP